MKKVFSVILVLLVVSASVGFLHLQKWRRYLAELSQGRTYQSYGMKIEIPSGKVSVKGFLKPRVVFPHVRLDLSFWGIANTVDVKDAELVVALFHSERLTLAFPDRSFLNNKVELKDLIFNLGQNNSILGIKIGNLAFQTKEGKQRLQFSQSTIKLGPVVGTLPDAVVFKTKALSLHNGADTHLDLDDLELRLHSNQEGQNRKWQWSLKGSEGKLVAKGNQGVISPWSLTASGQINEVSHKEIVNFAKSARPLLGPVLNWRPGVPSPLTREDLAAKVEQWVQFFASLESMGDSAEFTWGGLKLSDSKGKEKLNLAPWKLTTGLTQKDGTLHVSYQWNFGDVWFGIRKDASLALKRSSFNGHASYDFTDYANFIRTKMGYYVFGFSPHLPQETFQIQDIKKMMLNYIAAYPTRMDAKGQIGELTYVDPKNKVTHQNLFVTYKIGESGIEYSLGSNFDLQLEKNPLGNLEGAKGSYTMVLQLPWDRVLKHAQEVVLGQKTTESFLQVFSGVYSGVKLHADLNLGKGHFSAKLDTGFSADIGKVLSGNIDQVQSSFLTGGGDNLKKILVAKMINEGDFHFDLDIQQLTMLQQDLDKIKSGASLSLVTLAPFAKMGEKGDTLSMSVQLKSGELLVNGQKNPTLEKLLAPLKGP